MHIHQCGNRRTTLVALSYPQLSVICDMLAMFQPADDYEEVRTHELLEQLAYRRDLLAPKTEETAT